MIPMPGSLFLQVHDSGDGDAVQQARIRLLHASQLSVSESLWAPNGRRVSMVKAKCTLSSRLERCGAPYTISAGLLVWGLAGHVHSCFAAPASM